MTEFRIAHQLVANGRKKFLIPLLYEDVRPDELSEVDADLKLYIQTHTYTECTNLVRINITLAISVLLGDNIYQLREKF